MLRYDGCRLRYYRRVLFLLFLMIFVVFEDTEINVRVERRR